MDNFNFYLSENGYLIIEDLNIKYLVNLSESDIPSMPEAVESSVRIAGRDGDIVLNTTYKPLSFSISCYTDENLTLEQKVAEERKINNFLNSIKNNTVKFAIEKDDKFYEVKYNGLLSTINYPTFLQFIIPLKTSDSYGKSLTEGQIIGNGTANSNTIKEVGAIFTIEGPAQTPKISLNNYEMFYDNVLLENTKLVIDSEKSTITHVNETNGTETNAMRYYNHEFPKIQNGNNTLAVLSGIDNASQVNVKWHDLKL